ncbi:hypothetical protein LWI28_000684 [Acer negundo]|uniref:DUF4283 domain-containing protein n=1 Tax=Acer negundo TaxID=4023 RepID=A0AAD5NR30_ACENE|nr:hypothetical protein LWI28_000684 [Acer negundo]
MVAPSPVEPVVGGLGVCKDGVSLLAGSGSGAAGVSAAGGGKFFAQGLQRPIPSSKYRIPLRRQELINGDLGFVFSDVEMERAVEDLKHTLVLKLLSSRPSIDVLRVQIIKTWGFSEVSMIIFMDNHHVLLHLANEKDYIHAWAREGRVVDGCQFRLFNWFANFDVNKEPSIVPQWIFLLDLPLHLYRLDCLQSFATRFGRFLGTDNATLYRTRATWARMCVEVDLQEEVVEGFPLVLEQNQVWQQVRYEKRVFYYNKCFRKGHTAVLCRVGEEPIREEGLRKEREEKVWKEVGQKDCLEKVGGYSRREWGISNLKEKEFESLGGENLQLAVTVEESEIVLKVGKDIVNGQVEFDGGSLLATFVYAKCSQLERRVLWEQLHGSSAFNMPWVVLGDFNTIRFDTEMVRGRPRNSSSMAEFNECISRCGLLDLRFEGRQLSWCNGHQGLTRSWAKLDRVLINNEFIVKYSGQSLTECWFNRVGRSSQLGNLIKLIPCLVIWRLWRRRCAARLEGKLESISDVWIYIKHWVQILSYSLTEVRHWNYSVDHVLRNMEVPILLKK